jgi:hypothetical protein
MTLEEFVHLEGYAPNSNTIERMEGDEGYRWRKRVFDRVEEKLK